MKKISIEKLQAENEKLNRAIAALEKSNQFLENRVKMLEKEKAEFLRVKENQELYANFKQFEDMKKQLEHYKGLYEHEKKQTEQQRSVKSELLDAIHEVILDEDKKRDLESLKNEIKKLRLARKNERNAGRKPKADSYIDSVKNLINLHPSISTRQVAARLGVSHTTVAKIIQSIPECNK